MYIVAECGANFDTVDQVFAMIGKSKEAGCAYTKFQLYDESVIKDSPLRAELQKRMITREFAELLVEEGEADGQPVFFTPMFLEAVDWIADMGCPLIKIRYADRHNLKLVNKALEVDVPVMISADHRYLNYCRDPRVKLLYCISRYPAAPEDYHIIPEDFSTGSHTCAPVFAGVSDHTDQRDFKVMDRALECIAELCEVHVKMDDSHPIEDAWSKSFSDLKEWIANNHAEKKM